MLQQLVPLCPDRTQPIAVFKYYKELSSLSNIHRLRVQSSINDGAEFKAVADAMKVIGFTGDEIQTVYKILATILHLVTTNNNESLFINILDTERQISPMKNVF